MDNKLWGRIYGSKVPVVVINLFIVICFIKRAPAIRTQYWGYALRISVPFVVHSLGMTVLSSSDRIMITSLCGAKDNSLYSLAYSCAAVMNMFISALSAAIDPWLLESYQAKDDSCKKKMGLISALVMFGCIGAMLLAHNDRYIVEINGRYDGTSRFAPGHRWGLFTGYSAAWRLSEEDFIKDLNIFDQLKIRGSWGQMGNCQGGDRTL